MQRANPIDVRKALETVHRLKLAGLLFVPMPVISPDDYRKLLQDADNRLDILIKEAEEDERVL